MGRLAANVPRGKTLTLSDACTIMKVRRLHMKTILSAGVIAILLSAQTAPAQSATQGLTQAPVPVKPLTDSSHADAYYYFTVGHLQEEEYELNTSADVASQSIDSYKQALAIDPASLPASQYLRLTREKLLSHGKPIKLVANSVVTPTPGTLPAATSPR